MTTVAHEGVGTLLRSWRERRRLTQLDLALRTNVSARHLSFVETGRSQPTSALILRLAEQLEVPLRERNTLLLRGGYAPAYPERPLTDPPMSAVHQAIEHVLDIHLPYPAAVVDGHWELVAANEAVELLTAGSAGHLLEPPVNVLRLSLHPEGMAPRILNLAEWRAHLLERLDRDALATGDPALRVLWEELVTYPAPPPTTEPDVSAIVVPLRIRHGDESLSFLSMTTVFGTPREVTLSELAIESFYPADEETVELLRRTK